MWGGCHRAGMLGGCWFETVQRTCLALNHRCPDASRDCIGAWSKGRGGDCSVLSAVLASVTKVPSQPSIKVRDWVSFSPLIGT